MITDANNIPEFILNTFVGITGGDFVLIGILIFIIIAFALITGKARASTVVMVGVAFTFIFGLIAQQFVFLFWLALLGAFLVLVNGIRKWVTSP